MKVALINKFNRAEVDQRALARVDVTRIQESAAFMVNFIPSRLGNMIYRPGHGYILDLESASSTDHRTVAFISAIDDTAILDFADTLDNIEVIVNDVLMTGNDVTTSIANGGFDSNINNWTDGSGGAASIAWQTGGYLKLIGDGSSNAQAYQTMSTNTGVEHVMKLVIVRAPVSVKLGYSSAGDISIFSGFLKPGTHYLTFTPSANIYITFENVEEYSALIDSVSFIGSSTNLRLPFISGLSGNLQSLRTVQSIDIVFCSFDGGQPFDIEHRGDKSWSIVPHRVDDGPFKVINITNVTLTPAALSGDTTLTASSDYFTAGHVGALFKLISSGQKVTATVTAEDNGTNAVLITGVSSSRDLTIVITALNGTGSTVTLQRSFDEAAWDDVESYTANQNKTFKDGFDNSIFYYRLYVKTGDYSSGTISLQAETSGGSITGICRIFSRASATVVSVQVLEEFGSTDATGDWHEGEWSDANAWPSAVELGEGRMWFAGKDKKWGSVSDAYWSHDDSLLGDSQAIVRTIGTGPEANIKWIKHANQLIAGSLGRELATRSTSFGELLTQTTANIHTGSTHGSANVEAELLDTTVLFIQRSGIKMMMLDSEVDRSKFDVADAMLLNERIASAGIKRIAVARQPETRIFIVLNDGEVIVYTVDRSEDVSGWSHISRSDTIEDVIVLPDSDEDRIYLVIKRNTSFYLEKMAKFKDSEGGSSSHTFDSYVTYTSPGTATLTGMDHFPDTTSVGAWADGVDIGDFTVTSGQITVPSSSYTDVVVGLRYTADYVSSKLVGYLNEKQLARRKRIVDLALILMNFQHSFIKVGPSVARLKNMPAIENGKAVPTTTVTDYSELPFPFDGETESDPRIYIRATGPCTLLALSYAADDFEDDTVNKSG